MTDSGYSFLIALPRKMKTAPAAASAVMAQTNQQQI
jgi:hypothetical protein